MMVVMLMFQMKDTNRAWVVLLVLLPFYAVAVD
jgi:hypothetical protein